MRSTVHETLKVKRSKVTRSCDVVARKTSNISSKRHSVVEMHLSYRKSRSPGEWWGQIFDRKFLNGCFCACAVKICPKLAYVVVKSPQF